MRTKPLILLLDDEDMFLEIASNCLQAGGCDTVEAHSSEDAIKKAEELKPDLLLSDIFMEPDKSGWEVALELHRNPKTRDVKIAFFTSLKDPMMELKTNSAEITKELGDVTFFSKMDGVSTLAQDVKKLL